MRIFSFRAVFLWLFILSSSTFHLFTQAVTIGNNTPLNSSSLLDIKGVSGAFALPHVSTAQLNAVKSLQLYNFDTDCLEAFFSISRFRAIYYDCNSFPNPAFNLPSGYIIKPVTISGAFPGPSYSWLFESGTPASGTGQNIQVTWSSAGAFGVSVTVTNSAVYSSSLADYIAVSLCHSFSRSFTSCGNDCCRSTGGGGGSLIEALATKVAASDGQYHQLSVLNGAVLNLTQYNTG